MEAAVELAEPAYPLEPCRRTFHGRDIFSPAAAHLAAGIDLEALGPKIGPGQARPPRAPRARHRHSPDPGHRASTSTGSGTSSSTCGLRDLEGVGIEEGSRVEVAVGFERYHAVAARTFAEVRRGDIVLYEDAYGSIALAINRGNAAEMLVARVGQEIRLAALDA